MCWEACNYFFKSNNSGIFIQVLLFQNGKCLWLVLNMWNLNWVLGVWADLQTLQNIVLNYPKLLLCWRSMQWSHSYVMPPSARADWSHNRCGLPPGNSHMILLHLPTSQLVHMHDKGGGELFDCGCHIVGGGTIRCCINLCPDQYLLWVVSKYQVTSVTVGSYCTANQGKQLKLNQILLLLRQALCPRAFPVSPWWVTLTACYTHYRTIEFLKNSAWTMSCMFHSLCDSVCCCTK